MELTERRVAKDVPEWPRRQRILTSGAWRETVTLKNRLFRKRIKPNE